MQRLSSFLEGEWREGTGSQQPLYNPTNHDVVAETSTAGLDLGAAMGFARTHGVEALSAMTFSERGALLASMSKAIHSVREELIDLGRINAGNTRGDAKFDIDGATGTLMYYAKLGEALGDRRVILDGDPIQIGGARLVGQHILSGRPGVAVHINAFNFPAWGLAEKAACSILAGMPVVSKPATSTSLMTWALTRAITDADILPAGVLSLLCGSVGDLLDHVEWSDVVAFTGGTETAGRIRRHDRILETGAAVNIEADSVNSAILLPDTDGAAYDGFIRDVHREMTQKAGQKCTATRRVFVSEDMLDEVVEDLSERIGRTVVGDPALAAVHMGPLATPGQVDAAREGLAQLMAESDVVHGNPDGEPLEGVEAGQGSFITPLLLKAHDSHGAKAIHDIEVFGPVATVVPYDGTVADAAALVRRGQGSLVASVYGDDRTHLEAVIGELAGWHGRLVLTDGKVADKAFAPGMALPHLLHGGPGRAGGGEELGGERGMRLYQQRTAIQGNGPLIAKFLGA